MQAVEVDTAQRAGEMPVAKVSVTLGELPAAENTRALTETAAKSNTAPGNNTRSAEDDADSDKSAESKLKVPGKVAGLNGYIPVKATGTEITQTKADEIAKELSKGETGSNQPDL